MKVRLTLCFTVLMATTVGAEPLNADLCNFAIEGLTLKSSRADVAAVFAARGWNDLSTGPGVGRESGIIETIIFDRDGTRPWMQAACTVTWLRHARLQP